MKKEGIAIFVLFLLFSINFVIAEDSTIQQDTENIRNTVNQLPLNEEGKLDPDKLQNYTSKAEQRIAEINNFLVKLAWMKYLIGIVPEISFFFFFYLAILILVIVYLINIMSFTSFSKNVRVVSGLCGTAILIQTGVIYSVSKSLAKIFTSWWFYLIAIVVVVIISKFGSSIGQFAEARKKRIAEEKVQEMSKNAEEFEKGAMNAKTVNAFAEGINEGLERTTKDEF